MSRGNLRAAPAALTPAAVERILSLADMLAVAKPTAARAYRGPYPILSHRTCAELRRS